MSPKAQTFTIQTDSKSRDSEGNVGEQLRSCDFSKIAQTTLCQKKKKERECNLKEKEYSALKEL